MKGARNSGGMREKTDGSFGVEQEALDVKVSHILTPSESCFTQIDSQRL